MVLHCTFCVIIALNSMEKQPTLNSQFLHHHGNFRFLVIPKVDKYHCHHTRKEWRFYQADSDNCKPKNKLQNAQNDRDRPSFELPLKLEYQLKLQLFQLLKTVSILSSSIFEVINKLLVHPILPKSKMHRNSLLMHNHVHEARKVLQMYKR